MPLLTNMETSDYRDVETVIDSAKAREAIR